MTQRGNERERHATRVTKEVCKEELGGERESDNGEEAMRERETCNTISQGRVRGGERAAVGSRDAFTHRPKIFPRRLHGKLASRQDRARGWPSWRSALFYRPGRGSGTSGTHTRGPHVPARDARSSAGGLLVGRGSRQVSANKIPQNLDKKHPKQLLSACAVRAFFRIEYYS